MTFYIRSYTSEEKYDISKFMNYSEGVYDVIDSTFLNSLAQLPVVKYYYVDDGFRDIDLIASSEYGDCFMAYLIQYYNGIFEEKLPEGTVLKLFSPEDLDNLYFEVSNQKNIVSK